MANPTPPLPERAPRRAAGQPARLLPLLTLLPLLLAACGGGGSSSTDDPAADTRVPEGIAMPASVGDAVLDAQGRLLASNCFQCHGTGGSGGFDDIRGSEAEELREYRDLAREPARADIMAAHAQGYTDAQITLIIRYLKAQ